MSSNYAAAGRFAAKSFADIHDSNKSYGPKYGKLVETAQNIRSEQRQVASKLASKVTRAGIEAVSKTDSVARDSKNKFEAWNSKRKAGALGALSNMVVQGMVMSKMGKREYEGNDDYISQIRQKQEELQGKADNLKGEADTIAGEEVTANPFDGGGPKPANADAPTAPTAPTNQQQPNASPPPSSGGQVTFKRVLDLAKANGGTKFPEIVAAQATHETGNFNPNIDSVYNDTGGTNPFGQKGDRGYGTKNGWTIYPDLKTAVDDHIKLWHDTNNHSQNYNAFDNRDDGLAAVIPAYSPNADPANRSRGFTENSYISGVKNILSNNGF